MNSIQKTLLANAIFSGISGLTSVIFYKSLGGLFNLDNYNIFWIIGLVLIYFSSTIIYEVYKQRPLAIKWITIQDYLWCIASAIILVIRPFDISLAGHYIIAAIAVVVLFLAISQSRAIQKIR